MASISAIVYTSQTGFTRRYAELLAQKTGLPALDLEGDSAPARGTAVLYLGWLMAGSVHGWKKARRRYDVRGLCAVGMAPEANGKWREEQDLPTFYLRGGYAPDRLKGRFRLMMKPMAAMVTRAPAENEADRAMQEAFRQGGDWVDESRLEPVLAWLNGQ